MFLYDVMVNVVLSIRMFNEYWDRELEYMYHAPNIYCQSPNKELRTFQESLEFYHIERF